MNSDSLPLDVSQYTCKTCGDNYEYPNDQNLCVECFNHFRDVYEKRLERVINQWIAENPPPMNFCIYCGAAIPAINVHIYNFDSKGNGCRVCFEEMSEQMWQNRRMLAQKSKPKTPLGYVYFATNDKLIKIGHATNINKRMDVLGIEPIHHLQIMDYRKAERYFHEVFKEYRVKGEWFNLDENQIGWITRLWTPSDGIICDLNGFEIWRADNA